MIEEEERDTLPIIIMHNPDPCSAETGVNAAFSPPTSPEKIFDASAFSLWQLLCSDGKPGDEEYGAEWQHHSRRDEKRSSREERHGD
jgi:hypothetical protein